MIDSTDPLVIEEALQRTQGKSIINSINLEDGEERFERVVPLARKFGAALVVGCIDEDKEQAQAITRERKLAIAQRSLELLTEKYGVAPDDIYLRRAGVPGRHRRQELHRLRRRDDRGDSADQAGAARDARRFSASRTSPSACRRRDARC